MIKLVFAFLITGLLSSGFELPIQILKTNLTITVLDDTGNLQEEASVTLYNTEDDYRASKNPAFPTQVTDKKGKIKFKNLEPVSYFIEVKKGEKNNDGLGTQTGKLVEGKTNKVNIIIE